MLNTAILREALRCYLAAEGITPQSDPVAYDRAQREFAGWWSAGGSVRAFAANFAGRRRPW